MKKTFLTIAIVIALSSMLIAQPMPNRGGNGDRPFKGDKDNPRMKDKKLSDEDRDKMEKEMFERRIEMLKKILDTIKEKYKLNDEQRKQLEDIFVKMMENQQKLREEMKKELDALKKKHEEELKKLLGDKYDEFKKEMDKLEKSRQQGNQNRERENWMTPDNIAKALGLSEEQKKKFLKTYEKMMKDMSKLQEQARKDGWTSTKIKDKIEEINKELEKSLKEILTVVQWEKFNEIWKKLFLEQQNRQGPPNRKQFDPSKIIEELGLSESQKKTYEKALKNYEKSHAELMEILKDSGLNRKEIAEKMKSLKDKFDAEIKKILTSEQFEKLKELQKNAEQQLRDREPKQNQRRYNFENLVKILELNDEQQKAIKQFFEDFRDAAEKLREKQGNPDQMQGKMQKLFQELIEKIKSQLDDDQKKKLENWQNKPEKPEKPEKPAHPDKPENPVK